jgi:hypothetical protein
MSVPGGSARWVWRHLPWEIRGRLGNLADRIVTPSAAATAAGQAVREYSLPAAASLAVGALRSLTTSTAS